MMKILAECSDLFPERFLAVEFFPHRLKQSARQYSTKPFKANGTASVVTVKAGEEELFEARARENGEVKIIDSECWSQLRNQSRISLLQNKVYFGGALGRRATNAVNKTLSEWLKLLYTQREMMTCPMR